MSEGRPSEELKGGKEGSRGEEPTGGGGGMGDERSATLPDEVEAARSSTISLLPSAGAWPIVSLIMLTRGAGS